MGGTCFLNSVPISRVFTCLEDEKTLKGTPKVLPQKVDLDDEAAMYPGHFDGSVGCAACAAGTFRSEAVENWEKSEKT